MKNKIILLLAVSVLTFAHPAKAQNALLIGTVLDSVKANTTKIQTTPSLASTAVTVQYYLHQLTDTITGYVSVWASIDGTTYIPYPGADSVAIAAATDVKKLWFLSTTTARNPVKFIQVRTRCLSNTTNSTSKARLNTKILVFQ